MSRIGGVTGAQADRPRWVISAMPLEAGSQEALDFALLQRTAEALGRVDEALGRIDAGEYGACSECHVDISEQRLRALPFAVRCTACEERYEHDLARAGRSRWHGAPSDSARLASY